MSTNISFENHLEEPITNLRAELLEQIYKVVSVDGLIKKKERFDNNIAAFVIYYLDPNEAESQAILSILADYHLTIGFEIRNSENFGIYKKEIRKYYSSTGVYEDYLEIVLIDAQNRLVYERIEDVSNGETRIEIKKVFYDSTNKTYELIYDELEILLGISSTGSPFVPENDHFIRAIDFPIFFPNFLAENPYYSHGSP